MPMSYVYSRADKVFYFIVHIPLVRLEQVMDMFEYVPFPMTLSTSETHVALPPPGAHDVLAINQNQEYQLLSSGELQHCFKLAKVHYCKGRQVLKTNFRNPVWVRSTSKTPKPPPGTAISRSNPPTREFSSSAGKNI